MTVAIRTPAVQGVEFEPLKQSIVGLTAQVVQRINALRQTSGDQQMSLAQMFELQLAMTELENVSSMSTSVVSAMNQAIQSMAHNLGK